MIGLKRAADVAETQFDCVLVGEAHLLLKVRREAC